MKLTYRELLILVIASFLFSSCGLLKRFKLEKQGALNGIDISSLTSDKFCQFISDDFRALFKKKVLKLVVLKDDQEMEIQLNKMQLLPAID